MSIAAGGCLCGEIRYQVRSTPLRVTVCHCKFCQRATGGAYLVEPIFDEADFSIEQGEAKVYRHVSEGSGKNVDIHFCPTCGTKLFLKLERFDGVVGVYGGTFDDPNWFERNPDNTRHIFLSMAQTGTVIPPGINSFDEHAVLNNGEPIEPKVFSKPQVIK